MHDAILLLFCHLSSHAWNIAIQYHVLFLVIFMIPYSVCRVQLLTCSSDPPRSLVPEFTNTFSYKFKLWFTLKLLSLYTISSNKMLHHRAPNNHAEYWKPVNVNWNRAKPEDHLPQVMLFVSTYSKLWFSYLFVCWPLHDMFLLSETVEEISF